MTKRFLVTIGIMGSLSVIIGAVGSHFLEGIITDKQMSMFNTANDFLMYHTLALLALVLMKRQISRSFVNTIYYFFVIGITLFSGSLFIGSLKEVTGFDLGSFGTLAPIGGIMLIIGWITIIIAGLTYKHRSHHSHKDI